MTGDASLAVQLFLFLTTVAGFVFMGWKMSRERQWAVEDQRRIAEDLSASVVRKAEELRIETGRKAEELRQTTLKTADEVKQTTLETAVDLAMVVKEEASTVKAAAKAAYDVANRVNEKIATSTAQTNDKFDAMLRKAVADAIRTDSLRDVIDQKTSDTNERVIDTQQKVTQMAEVVIPPADEAQ